MEISSTELQEKIKNGENLIVDFWAEWCGPCKMLKPIFERVANETNAQMYTMDVDKNRDIAVSLGIRSVPTVKRFIGGKENLTRVGVLQENELKEIAKTLINE